MFNEQQKQKLEQIKSGLCVNTSLDTGINCFLVESADENGNTAIGAQFVLQQMVDYESQTVKRFGYVVSPIELDLVEPIHIVSKIVAEWNAYDNQELNYEESN